MIETIVLLPTHAIARQFTDTDATLFYCWSEPKVGHRAKNVIWMVDETLVDQLSWRMLREAKGAWHLAVKPGGQFIDAGLTRPRPLPTREG